MQRVANWLTPLIAIGVAVFIAVFLVQINTLQPMPMLQPAVTDAPPARKAAEPKRWLDALAKSEQEGYFYPVNEIFLKIDLDQKPITEQIYKLSAALPDPYQLFCIRQELDQHGLRYNLLKTKQGTELLIYSAERDEMTALAQRLNNYEISANITPYKEEKRWISIK